MLRHRAGTMRQLGTHPREAGRAPPHSPTRPDTAHLALAGSELVQRTIAAMVTGGCEEVALEAEVTNSGALRLYQKLGFIRDKRLHRQAPAGREGHTAGVHSSGEKGS